MCACVCACACMRVCVPLVGKKSPVWGTLIWAMYSCGQVNTAHLLSISWLPAKADPVSCKILAPQVFVKSQHFRENDTVFAGPEAVFPEQEVHHRRVRGPLMPSSSFLYYTPFGGQAACWELTDISSTRYNHTDPVLQMLRWYKSLVHSPRYLCSASVCKRSPLHTPCCEPLQV